MAPSPLNAFQTTMSVRGGRMTVSLGCAKTPSDLTRVAVMGETHMWNILEDPAMVSFIAFSGVLSHHLLS